MNNPWIKLFITISIVLYTLSNCNAQDEMDDIEYTQHTKIREPGLYYVVNDYFALNNIHPASLNQINRMKKEAGLKEYWIGFRDSISSKTRSVLENILPAPLKHYFNKPKVINPIYETPTDENEHGTLDFVGRDFVRGVGSFANGLSEKAKSTAQRVGKKLHIIPSDTTVSEGLDTNKTFFDGVAANFQNHLRAIAPGTRWCGDGDKARSYDDLGQFAGTDRCCRSHDKCPSFLSAGENKFGLINGGLFTRSHCDCDNEFYQCLKANSNSLISKNVGHTYFTVLGPQCFKEEFPKLGCVSFHWGKCTEYHLNTNGTKKYQWFDSPPF